MFYPDRQIERTVKAAMSFLDLPNLRRIYLNELPLLESSNPKLWLIALIVADEPQLPTIVEKVKAYRASNPSDGIDWIELLETVLICKLPDSTREEILTMFGLSDILLKHTRVYQDAVKEAHLEGHIKRRMEGLLETKLKVKQLCSCVS